MSCRTRRYERITRHSENGRRFNHDVATMFDSSCETPFWALEFKLGCCARTPSNIGLA